MEFLADRYRLPQPRLAVGQALVGIAHAMMDVSDGLVQDLGHLAQASGLAATIEAASLPLSPPFQQAISRDRRHLMAALAGGDDYELLFAAPAAAAPAIAALARETGVAITAIGRMEQGSGVRVVDGDGAPMAIPVGGYRHF
jgi:thiamine-monophosphate kinase